MNKNTHHSMDTRLAISRGLAASDKTIGRPNGAYVLESTRQKMSASRISSSATRFDIETTKRLFCEKYPSATYIGHDGKLEFDLYGAIVSVKTSSKLVKSNDWRFGIYKNTECDIFAFMAFDNIKDCNLIHMWMMPAASVSHLTGVSVSEGTKAKWDEYEIDLATLEHDDKPDHDTKE